MEEELRMIRVLSLFSGIGAFEKALKRLGVEHDVVNYCEIDPYTGKAYSLIHGISQEKNLVDVTKVDTSKLENIDMVTYGFPCVDISIAGKMKGFEDEDGNTTRSGLFFEALRIIQDTKPKYAIAENVKNLMSKSFERILDIVLNSLGADSYNNYIKVLNAKDYGIPQNRERVFIVSIRKDIDDFSFCFPKKETLELRFKDLLEESADERYYIKKNITLFVKKTTDKTNPKVIQIANICPTKARKNPNAGKVYDKDGLSPTLTSMQGGNRQPMIVEDSSLRIRKLTPKECFRLMGFDDKDIDILIENGISNTQLYKMAGNSIVVDVLERLFECLLLKKKEEPDLFSMMFEM